MIIVIPDGDVLELALKCHQKMEDSPRYTLDDVCLALNAYLPVMVAQIVETADDFTAGEASLRPREFNAALGREGEN